MLFTAVHVHHLSRGTLAPLTLLNQHSCVSWSIPPKDGQPQVESKQRNVHDAGARYWGSIRRQYPAENSVISAGCILLKKVDSTLPAEEGNGSQPTQSWDPVLNYNLVVVRIVSTGELIFPKGRKDIGESIYDAAIRETFENTGYPCRLLPLPVPTKATIPPALPTSASSSQETGQEAAQAKAAKAALLNFEPIACLLYAHNMSEVQKMVFWYTGIGFAGPPACPRYADGGREVRDDRSAIGTSCGSYALGGAQGFDQSGDDIASTGRAADRARGEHSVKGARSSSRQGIAAGFLSLGPLLIRQRNGARSIPSVYSNMAPGIIS